MAKTAADILVDTLVDEWGVRHIFGLPGDGINGIMESLRQRQDAVQFIQVRHEESAAFMACAYAKFTGRLGVCLATSGPGAIHLLNGLYDAKLDGASVLALTGQTYHDLLGTFYQQEVDLIGLFKDVAVYNHEVRSPSQVEALVHEACKSALWRRSVSHICFPTDIQHEPAPEKWVQRGKSAHKSMGHVAGTWTRPVPVPPEPALDAAAEVLNAGKKVTILVGAGALGAGAEVLAVAERLNAPVVHALLGKAVVADASPHSVGGIGLLGDRPGQLAMEQCDTLLIVGSSMPYLNYYPQPGEARAVQIDINPERLGLRYPVEVGLPGDTLPTLQRLLLRLKQNEAGAEWLEQLRGDKADWKKVLAERGEDASTPIKPQRVAWELNRQLPDNAILTGDSGTNTTFFARYLEIRPGMLASCSGNLATMAPGLPYAIAAQVAHPDRRAVAFVGDGGFSMLMAEVLTAVRYKLPIVVVILRNDYLGMIRWEQMAFVGVPEFGVDLTNPYSFAQWATNCGGLGIKVEDPTQLETAFRQAFAKTDGPSVIEAVVDPMEAPLPPKVSMKHAMNMMRAVAKGQPNSMRIGLTLFRDKVDEVLVQGLGAIPGIRGADKDGDESK